MGTGSQTQAILKEKPVLLSTEPFFFFQNKILMISFNALRCICMCGIILYYYFIHIFFVVLCIKPAPLVC